jgi:hypothetical protein
MMGRPVAFADDCIGETAEKAVAALKPGDILLLENVRYYNEEEANDPAFAEKLAAWPMFTSTTPLAPPIAPTPRPKAWPASSPGAAASARPGLLMERELQYLGQELEKPARPFVVILGGAKVSDKIKVIDRLLEKADTILIGGAMAYTFKLAQGRKVGKSLSEPDKQDVARAAMEKAKARNVQFLLPSDNVIGTPVNTGKLNKKGKPIIDIQNPQPTATRIFRPRRKAWTSARTRPGVSAKSSCKPRRLFGTARWACSRTRASPKAPTPSPARWPKPRPNGAKSIIGGGDSVKALNQSRPGRQGHFYEHRRRGQPGIPGRPRPARSGGAFRQNIMNKERKLIIAGNWKMNKTAAEALALVKALKMELANIKEVDVVVCPPFTALADVAKAVLESSIRLGAQNMSENNYGAFTGEIAAGMLKEFSVRYVILGHSERRQYQKESDELISKKAHAAHAASLGPLSASAKRWRNAKAA